MYIATAIAKSHLPILLLNAATRHEYMFHVYFLYVDLLRVVYVTIVTLYVGTLCIQVAVGIAIVTNHISE